MFEWFRALSAKEIGAMLSMLTLQEGTKAYRSIFAEGAAKRKVIALRRLFKRRFAAGASQPIEAVSDVRADAWLDTTFDSASVERPLGAASGLR